MSSPAFTQGHDGSSGSSKPVATGSEVWFYEVAQFEEL
jgi:hypothetical protein